MRTSGRNSRTTARRPGSTKSVRQSVIPPSLPRPARPAYARTRALQFRNPAALPPPAHPGESRDPEWQSRSYPPEQVEKELRKAVAGKVFGDLKSARNELQAKLRDPTCCATKRLQRHRLEGA